MSAEARALPARSHGWFRRWFRKVWKVRGGGLYACGFAISFAIYELGSVVEDFKEIGLLFDGQVIQFFVNFLVDSIKNTIKAFMWPVEIVQYSPPLGAIALGAAFVLFPKTLKKPIERWLFADAPDERPADEDRKDDAPTSSQ